MVGAGIISASHTDPGVQASHKQNKHLRLFTMVFLVWEERGEGREEGGDGLSQTRRLDILDG